jgi:Bacterial Ig-like domain (group 2)
MRAMLPSIATLAILCVACSDSSTPPTNDSNREAVASVVGGVTYPLVKITPTRTALKVADSVTAKAYLTDANGSWYGKYITWTSSDASVLRVTTTGTGSAGGSVAHIKALKTGTATITATTQSKTYDRDAITVSTTSTGDTVVTRVSVTPNPLKIATGATYQLVGRAYNAAGTVITSAKLSWRSTGSALSVSTTGVVKGMSVGTANIEARSSNGKMAWSTVSDTGGVATASPTAPTTGGGVAAVWSDKFVGSVGVATHFSYYDLLPYGSNRSATINAIKAGGFRFVRDGLSVDVNQGSNDLYWGIMKTLTQSGLKLILVTQPVYLGNNTWVQSPYSNQSNIDTAVARVGASGILAFEGPNEVDNNNGFWGGIPAFGANAKAYQSAMYKRVKQIAPSITVIGLTTTSAYGSSFIGDISSYMDAGTLHPYPGGGVPTAALSSTMSALSVLNGANKPWWVTESGYHTAPNATQMLYQPGVSQQAQGKYVPRLYLDYFKAGISHTSVYELIDERSDGNNAEMNYGLLRNDGSPKPAYTALKNMLTLLADPGSTYSPSTLSYTLTGATSTVRQSLFQKRDGRFYLVLWNDVPVYNTSSKQDISNAAVPVTVTFGTQPRAIARYTPFTSSAGTSVTAARSVSVAVPDHPVILEVTP